jgi:hypothetical protein
MDVSIRLGHQGPRLFRGVVDVEVREEGRLAQGYRCAVPRIVKMNVVIKFGVSISTNNASLIAGGPLKSYWSLRVQSESRLVQVFLSLFFLDPFLHRLCGAQWSSTCSWPMISR